MNTQQLREAFDAAPPGFYRDVLLAIAITEAECPEGMPLWAYWNATYLPEFKGMPLDKLFTNIIEPTAKDLGNMFKTKQH
ncbi:MAG: hypothetical protein WCZ18_03840 [Ottowia sp.]|nr:hypothetical protein [Ottowia sp.]